jgi:hypothetical protein
MPLWQNDYIGMILERNSAMQCDLCKHEEAIANGALCPVCQEAIVRLANAITAIQADLRVKSIGLGRHGLGQPVPPANSRRTRGKALIQEEFTPRPVSFLVECSTEEYAAAFANEMCGTLHVDIFRTCRRAKRSSQGTYA